MRLDAKQAGEFAPLYYSAQVFEVDRAQQLLKAARIPHYARQITISGLSLAVLLLPAVAPGQYWGVFVPRALHEQARAALEEQGMSITAPPEPWAFAPLPGARRILKALIVLVLLALAGLAIAQLASLL